MARIGFYCIAIFFAYYINKVFISKIKENTEQITYQRLISDVSADYLSVNQNNLSQTNNKTLRQTGQFFKAGRTSIFLFDAARENLVLSGRWDSIEQHMPGPDQLPVAEFLWLCEKVNRNSVICVSDMDLMSEEKCREIRQFVLSDSKALIALPIVNDGNILGFLSFEFGSSINISDSQLNILMILANILADATERVRQEKEINQMAYFDHLTRLPNRALFKDRVNQSILLSKRTNKKIAVIFLDMDHFKSVNDTMGHQGGDDFLIKISEELLKTVRKYDTVSRFGGDEFLIMLNNLESDKDIIKITQKIIGLFNKPFCINKQEFFITASAGVALYPADGEDAETLIKSADIAMYKAKEKGKNRFELCSPDIKEEIERKIKLSNGLYRALERNELMLYYQPQICLQTQKIMGVEALIRWNHPEMGLTNPSVFIPLAEHSGLISPIGEWVLRTACIKNKAWQDSGLPFIRMGVNISVNQFRNPDFVRQVQKILDETGLNPQYLELEITESVAIKESGYIIDVLNDLKKLGIQISIDDFGTEYSSLSRLKLLPIDRIKMDIQFVQGIDGTDKDRAITKIIINLAQNLGLKVVAEGVETEKQLEFLHQRMCDEVQGFYYYHPLTEEEIVAVLKQYAE